MFKVTAKREVDETCFYTLKIGDRADLTATIHSNASDREVAARLRTLSDLYWTQSEGLIPPVEKINTEVLVWYDILDVNGNFLMQTFDRYPNCTFEVNRAGVCKIYDADKKLIASVRGWKKVSYA